MNHPEYYEPLSQGKLGISVRPGDDGLHDPFSISQALTISHRPEKIMATLLRWIAPVGIPKEILNRSGHKLYGWGNKGSL